MSFDGKSFVEQALKAGHTVTLLARTPSKVEDIRAIYPNNLQIIKGDANNKSDVDQVF